MADESRFKRFRAIMKNAVVWGVTWGALGSAFAALMRLGDGISPGFALLDGIGMGIRIGVVGGLAGAAFSTIISLAYRGKNLRDINPLRFGIGAAIFAGAFVPVWMQTMNLITGGGLVPFNLINTDIVYSALFGGITGAGTVMMAQRDEAKNPDVAPELAAGRDSRALDAGAGVYHDTNVRSHEPRHGT